MKPCAAPSSRLLLSRLLFGAVLTLGTTVLHTAHAQSWVFRYDAFLGANGSQLGSSMVMRVELDAGEPRVTRIYVGAPYATKDGLLQAGAVYIYNPSPQGWQLANIVYSNMPQAGAHFGATLAQGGFQLVVSAPDFGSSSGAGAGRVEFYTDFGFPDASLVFDGAVTGGAGQHYGRSLAMDTNMLAISYMPPNDGGCVASFIHDPNYPAEPYFRPLPATNNIICGAGGAKLGASLAIRRNSDTSFVLVAGAPGESQNDIVLAGAAHVYVPNSNVGAGGLIEVGTLAAPNPAYLDGFGTSVGVDANYVYVGAPGRDNGFARVGSVMIFKTVIFTGYELLDEYFPVESPDIGGHCGATLTIDQYNNDRFIVGCPDSSDIFIEDGEARVYRKRFIFGQLVWTESLLTTHTSAPATQHLGSSVAILGSQAFVGAKNTNPAGPEFDNGGWWEFGPNYVIFKDGFQ